MPGFRSHSLDPSDHAPFHSPLAHGLRSDEARPAHHAEGGPRDSHVEDGVQVARDEAAGLLVLAAAGDVEEGAEKRSLVAVLEQHGEEILLVPVAVGQPGGAEPVIGAVRGAARFFASEYQVLALPTSRIAVEVELEHVVSGHAVPREAGEAALERLVTATKFGERLLHEDLPPSPARWDT